MVISSTKYWKTFKTKEIPKKCARASEEMWTVHAPLNKDVRKIVTDTNEKFHKAYRSTRTMTESKVYSLQENFSSTQLICCLMS